MADRHRLPVIAFPAPRVVDTAEAEGASVRAVGDPLVSGGPLADRIPPPRVGAVAGIPVPVRGAEPSLSLGDPEPAGGANRAG
jgi:hypothetical protein